MLKKHKSKIIITSLITILPVIIGLILWNQLPDQIPVHWNAAGEIDGYSGKAFAVFMLPLFLLAIHLVCLVVVSLDPKSKNISGRILGIVLWICPLVSLIMNCMVYAVALGIIIDVNIILSFLTGILFIIVGSYLPKCPPNYTIGIKLPWTLHDENNWIATHRFAGPLWIAGGILLMLTTLVFSAPAGIAALIVVITLLVIAPAVYSLLYYKRNS